MKTRTGIGILTIMAMASTSAAADFLLTSPQLQDGGRLDLAQVFRGAGCSGQNISPELQWRGEPAGTRSFAVTVYDPDAPTGRGWWHWWIVNIPAETHQLPAGAGNRTLAQDGSFLQGRNDFGSIGYGGACPPAGHGDHRYQFQVWALGVERLEVGHHVSGEEVMSLLNQHVLDRAGVTVRYGR